MAPCNFGRHASLSTDLSEIECRFDIDLEVVAAKMSGLGFAAAALWVLVENRLDRREPAPKSPTARRRWPGGSYGSCRSSLRQCQAGHMQASWWSMMGENSSFGVKSLRRPEAGYGAISTIPKLLLIFDTSVETGRSSRRTKRRRLPGRSQTPSSYAAHSAAASSSAESGTLAMSSPSALSGSRQPLTSP